MKRTVLAIGIGLVTGQTFMSPEACATTLSFDMNGMFTMLNYYGSAIANSSISSKGANKYQTAITGTMTYDVDSGAGMMTIAPFDWLGNGPSVPFTFKDIALQSVGDGNGGTGPLIVGNMLYDWNNNTNVPVSVVWDGSGFLDAIASGLSVGSVVSGTGATPAADGTYVQYGSGAYLSMGPSPLATTTGNTSNAPGCTLLDCMGIYPSGLLPLLVDTLLNQNKSDSTGTDVYGIGGSLVMESGFNTKSFNFDFTAMTLTSINPNDHIAPYDLSPVPLPASLWLFGSGLVGLIGVA